MQTENKLLRVAWLFEGEGGGEGGESTGATESATPSGKGEFSAVVFGKQSEAQGQEPEGGENNTEPKAEAQPKAEDVKPSFDDLIAGEYKEAFTKKTQEIINRRFKETKKLENQVSKLQPLIDVLSQKYGTSDADAILNAVNEDNSLWSDAADEAGMTVEQFKQFKKLERDNAMYRAEQERAKEQQRVEQQVQTWVSQSEALSQKYPSFSLDNELQNEQFASLLKSGVPVETAFNVVHMDEIINDTLRTTAEAVEKKVVDNVRAKGNRPQENGTASRSAFTVKDDVSKLTREERAEIARRVSRGDYIEF